ncbi:MAG TPA: septum formation protein Maf [Cytophagales bacterium]|nr:septum formation protein Maf [Cytophagales bacterium]HCR53660.1 septum formation protein Maf [Cytophagales bacterium]
MNFKRPLILGSSSPRRQFLMKEAGYAFTLAKPEGDESFPSSIPVEVVPQYLAEKKAKSIEYQLKGDEVILTSDTVVILNGQILNKPTDREHAMAMLSELSGKTHTVITAVCLLDKQTMDCFDDRTRVTFKQLTPEEIAYYVDNYQPYDKAGAYGAQDWIGMVAIEKIEGSYFTVMGLPMHKVYTHLQNFQDSTS